MDIWTAPGVPVRGARGFTQNVPIGETGRRASVGVVGEHGVPRAKRESHGAQCVGAGSDSAPSQRGTPVWRSSQQRRPKGLWWGHA